jgi:hypothetical protein
MAFVKAEIDQTPGSSNGASGGRTDATGDGRAGWAHGLEPVSPPGSARVDFKDPDGNILQLS